MFYIQILDKVSLDLVDLSYQLPETVKPVREVVDKRAHNFVN